MLFIRYTHTNLHVILNTDSNIGQLWQVGDDLRQDILVLQMIKLMEKIWLRAGLDLKMVTYQCVATGVEEGNIETTIT